MPKMPNYFAEKTIVTTGAGSGIGRAIALIFAREGAYVVCADINEKGASEMAAEVSRKGSKALAIKVDVTKRIEVDDMAERAIAAFGRRRQRREGARRPQACPFVGAAAEVGERSLSGCPLNRSTQGDLN